MERPDSDYGDPVPDGFVVTDDTTVDALAAAYAAPVPVGVLVERVGAVVRSLSEDELRPVERAARIARASNAAMDFEGRGVAALDDATPEELRALVGEIQKLADCVALAVGHVAQHLEARRVAGAVGLAAAHQEMWDATVKLSTVTADVAGG